MFWKASGRKQTRSDETGNPSVGSRDQVLYLYTFETTTKYYYYSELSSLNQKRFASLRSFG